MKIIPINCSQSFGTLHIRKTKEMNEFFKTVLRTNDSYDAMVEGMDKINEASENHDVYLKCSKTPSVMESSSFEIYVTNKSGKQVSNTACFRANANSAAFINEQFEKLSQIKPRLNENYFFDKYPVAENDSFEVVPSRFSEI